MTAGEVPVYSDAFPHARLQAQSLEAIARSRLRCLLAGADPLVAASLTGSEDQVWISTAAADAIGHYTLCLVFGVSHALGEWLVAHESALLRRRWAAASSKAKAHALAAAGLKPGDRELSCLLPFYELPRQLLADRRALLSKGMALVTEDDALGILLEHTFSEKLRSRLARSGRLAAELAAEPMLKRVMDRLHDVGNRLLTVYRSKGETARVEGGFAQDGGGGVGLSLSNFEGYLHQSFPPCMRHLVLWQRGSQCAGKHLKHLGRLQLRPFLREAGLEVGAALQWWETEMCRDPAVTQADFQRKYACQVEHAHGHRGHGRGAFAFSCKKLIGFQPASSSQAHGCPFQQLTPQELQRYMPYWSVPSERIEDIVATAFRAGPHAACGEFFEAIHPGCSPELPGALHPMEFLRRSRRHWTSEALAERPAQALPVAVASAPGPALAPAGATAPASMAPASELLSSANPDISMNASPNASTIVSEASASAGALANESASEAAQVIPATRLRREPFCVATGPFPF